MKKYFKKKKENNKKKDIQEYFLQRKKNKENDQKLDPLHPFTHISKKIKQGFKVVIPLKPDKEIQFDEYKKDCYRQEILILKSDIDNIEIEREILDKKDKIGLFINFSESSKMNKFKEFIIGLFRNYVLSSMTNLLMISGDLKDNIEVIKNQIINKNIFDNFYISKLSIRFYTYYELLFFDQSSIINNDRYERISGFKVEDKFEKEYINNMKKKMRGILKAKKKNQKPDD